MRNCFHNGSKESSVLRLMRRFPPGKTSEFLESKPAICPRKKYYDKRPNDRTVSTASYRSPAFTCRRMRCMWFLTVCSERCKAREASAMDVLAAVCAVARGEAVCPNAVERKAMRLT